MPNHTFEKNVAHNIKTQDSSTRYTSSPTGFDAMLFFKFNDSIKNHNAIVVRDAYDIDSGVLNKANAATFPTNPIKSAKHDILKKIKF